MDIEEKRDTFTRYISVTIRNLHENSPFLIIKLAYYSSKSRDTAHGKVK